jgi:outer membrane usher protein FimD/PapC
VTASSTALVGSSSGRGIALSAYPLDRPDSFERTTIDGNAPPGWDVELFRGNELLAFSQVDAEGRYEFPDVPLLFGDNALRVVLHGADGQMREITRVFRVGAGMANPGVAYWRVFAGERNTRLLDSLLAETEVQYPAGGVYTAEADVGIAGWLTANAFAARSAENNRVDSPLQDSYGGGLRLSLPLA